MSRSSTPVAAEAGGRARLHPPPGLRIPTTGLARARWSAWAISLAVSLCCIPAVVVQADVGLRAAGLVGLATLMSVRVTELRRGRLLAPWTEVPQGVALALAATAAGPLAVGLGLFFSGCFFRAVYASSRRAALATVGAVALLAACASASVPGWHRSFVSHAFGIVVVTLLARVLVALVRQNELVVRNERLLAAVFDNLDVSVMVEGSSGAPGMMNRAARGLHDGLGLPGAPRAWHDSVEVYEGDGRTPLPPEEMPAALALRGERVRDKPLVLGLADGTRRYYSVNAARFGDDGAASQVVVTVHEVTAQREAQLELAHVAAHDPLTGLANRTLLTGAVQAAVEAMRDHGPRVSLLLLDLDGFKRINDSLGHAFGDQVLQAVAARLRSVLRPQDLVARLGGDEFAVLVADGALADELAQRVSDSLRQPMSLSRSRVTVSASVGLVHGSAEADASALLAAADMAMYAAKAAGPGQVRLFRPEMRRALDDRLHLEAELGTALREDQFELHYQPYVNIETGTVTGAEALVRWRHPTRGLLLPAAFVPVVEDTSMIVPLGRWILRTAVAAAAAWQPADPAHLRTMSVNVSARQLDHPDLLGDVAAALSTSGLPPGALTVEITESALVDNSEVVLARLRGLKELGVMIAVDDFGTGYSSLSRLRSFPVDVLKIDRSFVKDVESHAGRALVKAIVALSEALGLDTVAEGVESAAQAELLAALGCRIAQGYYFATPAPASDMSWVARSQPA
jgi:diguanylate cyclase (GGDEF)-like protein